MKYTVTLSCVMPNLGRLREAAHAYLFILATRRQESI